MEISELISEPVQILKDAFTGVVSQLLIALVIFFIGVIVGKFVGKVVTQILHQFNVDYFIKKTTGVKFSLEEIIGVFTRYFVYFIAMIMALNQLGLTTTMFLIIFTALIVLVVISIILGIKDFVPNFIAGIMIKQKSFINLNDLIRIKDIEGKVISINLIETLVENKHGDIIYIPNSIITTHEVINFKIKKPKGKK